jgi:hypothetical protein
MATPVVGRVVAIPRQQGIQVPAALPAATWVDSRVLAANVAEAYTMPAGGMIIGINATTGPLYINFNAAAAVPVADVNDGTSSIMLRTDAGSPFLITPPLQTSSMSMICGAACVVTIEVWG